MSEMVVDFKDIQKTLEPIFGGQTVRIVMAGREALISFGTQQHKALVKDKKQAYESLKGILEGHEVDLSKERQERILER